MASIFFSLGQSTSVSSLEGRQVYWKLSGIQDSDLAYGYGMSGSATVIKGKLQFNTSLVQDNIVEKEKLSISVYADPAFSIQLGQDFTSVIGGDIGSSRVIATRSTKLDANTSQLSLSGNYAINGTGNTLDNLIEGNDKANVLDGGKGDDVLAGGFGNDTYIVDSAYDVIIENSNAGNDLISSSISWTLGSNIENLMLIGDAAINGKGNGDDNTITGNSAKNILDGGAGNDLLVGGSGDDTYIVDSAGDIIKEQLNQGLDSVESSVDWALGANLENLYLKGTASINGTGNSGSNIIIGNIANT
jgi:Ca2+-binding RTX toxin-like protein